MREQRQHPRVPIRHHVWCEGDGVTLYVQALDVSRGGMFVRMASPPERGRRIRVSFEPEANHEIVALAEVVWTRRDRRAGMGLRILRFESGSADFERFVTACLRSGAPGDPS